MTLSLVSVRTSYQTGLRNKVRIRHSLPNGSRSVLATEAICLGSFGVELLRFPSGVEKIPKVSVAWRAESDVIENRGFSFEWSVGQ